MVGRAGGRNPSARRLSRVVGAITLTATGRQASRSESRRAATGRCAGSCSVHDETGRSQVAAARSVTDGADLRPCDEGYNSGDVLFDHHGKPTLKTRGCKLYCWDSHHEDSQTDSYVRPCLDASASPAWLPSRPL